MPRHNPRRTLCRTIRLRLGLTQREFAKKLERSASLIQAYELGKLPPPAEIEAKMIMLDNPKNARAVADKLVEEYRMRLYRVIDQHEQPIGV